MAAPYETSKDGPPSYGDVGVLLEPLIDWADGAATRRKIPVDNPARLYGFDKG